MINKQEGNKWIVLAAKRTDTPAGISAQGYCLQFAIGEVVIRNIDKAKECYDAAIKQGYVPAMYSLGSILQEEAVTVTTSTVHAFERPTAATTKHTHKDDAGCDRKNRNGTPAGNCGDVNLDGELWQRLEETCGERNHPHAIVQTAGHGRRCHLQL